MSTPVETEVLSVSALNRLAKGLLEEQFAGVWVEGEVSNLAIPASGHMYFSLKDSKAQVRCAFFKGKNRFLNFTLKEGDHVMVRANVSLFEGRGDFQLIVQHLELQGEGALKREFELLKIKLHKAGLFDVAHKKPMPAMPKTIGIVTSATGAAIRDILQVLRRRYPIAKVIIYPCQVQGVSAHESIIKALNQANQRLECDIIILSRGGGSLEDLWCFNHEALAYTIFESQLPIICGVGHEIDITIADLVADVRAPTPSAAAEMVSPDKDKFLQAFVEYQRQLSKSVERRLSHLLIKITALSKQLRHPNQMIQEQMQKADFLAQKLNALMQQLLKQNQFELKDLQKSLIHFSPLQSILQDKVKIASEFENLKKAWQKIQTHNQQRYTHLTHRLNTISPLATLARGYAIAQKSDESIIHSVQEVDAGEIIQIRLAEGQLNCEVKEKFMDEKL